MKKRISVITLIPRSGQYYARQVQELFGDQVEVRAYSTGDRSIEKISKTDLYLVSTDAFEEAKDQRQYVPADGPVVEIQVNFPKEVVQRLKVIPKGTPVLFVNITHQMAREAITQLEQLGVNQLHFIPYGADSFPPNDSSTLSEHDFHLSLNKIPEDVEIAVTPDEVACVPSSMKKIINIGHRPCTSSTMIEIAVRLGLENLMEGKRFQTYMKSMTSENYSFEQMFLRSRQLESRFDLMVEILDEGIIGVNEKSEIFICNHKAGEITGTQPQLIIGQDAAQIFPYIPFKSCMHEKNMRHPKLIRIGAVNINMTVAPVIRHGECIGAFATLQRFNELERRQNELRSQLLHKGYRAKYCFDDVIGHSPSIARTKSLLQKMALTDSPVLLIGETGTGKELFAHAVHQASARKEGPFIAINVAAMPENLLESELFGYEEGAFTGAKKGGRPGLFEFAQKGTLFLDEVEGMSQAMQVKLLRVLQEREIMRVGGNQIINVDVRIIAATNEVLEEMVEKGSFRRDLYYRLNALPALIPPLRERGDDILLLLDNFRNQTGGNFELSGEVRQIFLEYRWPGNIRELRNVVEYLSFTGEKIVHLDSLPPTFMRTLHHEKNCQKPPAARTAQTTTTETAAHIPDFHTSVPDTPAPGSQALSSDTDFWFVLEQLYLASEQNLLIGRETILSSARQLHLPLSQKEVRLILGKMSEQGLVKVGRGRGGSRITPEGRMLWEQYCNRIH